jgi:hypothetical protein
MLMQMLKKMVSSQGATTLFSAMGSVGTGGIVCD